MNISGIVVVCRPEDLSGATEALNALPWAEVHYTDPRGRLVATIEAADTDESMARLGEIQALPRVLMAELAGYYLDEDGQRASSEAEPESRQTNRNSLRHPATRCREGES